MKAKKSVRHFMTAILLWLILCMTGCGSPEESQSISPPLQQKDVSAPKIPDTELAYMPEYTPLELGTGEEPYMAKIFGSSLYYISRQYGDTVEDSKRSICEYSLTESQVVRKVLVGECYGDIFNFSVAEDGSVYVLDFASEDGTNSGMNVWLLGFDPQGQRCLTVNLLEEAGIRAGNIPLAVDAQGRIYLAESGRVVLFEADGSLAGEVPLKENHSAAAMGRDLNGRIYISSFGRNEDSYQLAEVNFEERTLGESHRNYPVNRQKELISAPEGGFLVNAGNEVYHYDPDTETARQLFTWLNCDISSSSIVTIAPGEGESIQSVLYENRVAELPQLSQKDIHSMPEKTELIFGTLDIWPELENAVTSFNRRSSQYHITIREYNGLYEHNEQDAITALNLDLVSAHDCPDILNLHGLNVEAYAHNGVFEDLGTWLAGSEILKREEYVENILNNYTYGGQLVSIPHCVSLSTLSGSRQRVGKEPGWTLPEMMECAKANQDVELFSVTYNQWVLRTCMTLDKSAFLDLEQGKCHFDSDTFKSLLQFAASYPDTPNQNYIDITTGIMKDKVLCCELDIHAFQDIQLYETMYKGEMTLIGYPTADGEGSGCRIDTTDAYAMTARSEHKEGVWEFLEYFLDRDVENGLPTHREKLQEMTTTVVYFRDNQGWIQLGLDGLPALKYDTINYNGWPYKYHEVTEEEIATLVYLMDTGQVSTTMDDVLWKIILDEAVPCFQGQKTLEDTASAIQRRASLYLQENK